MVKSNNPKRRGRKNPKPSKSFVKKVMTVIHKTAESKQAFTSQSNVFYNSGINANGDTVSILPSITKGTNDNQRIGDQLRGQRLQLKGAIQLVSPQGTLSNCRVAVRMMVVMPKQYTVFDNSVTGGWMPYLLKKGGATTAFTGILSDLWAPINTDMITKYFDKVFYLNTAYNAAAGISTLGNSVKFFSHKFNLKNKLLKYDDAAQAGTLPVGYAPQIILGYVHMDGTGPDTLTTAITMSFDSIFTYEDA